MSEPTKDLSELPTEVPPVKRPRGFAALKLKNPELVRQIARAGGIVAQERGTAHRFTREEAIEAGRKGGKATHAKRRGALPSP